MRKCNRWLHFKAAAYVTFAWLACTCLWSRSYTCKSHERTIAVFSYIWFKYDILSLHCCKLHSVLVIVLSFQPSHPGLIRAWVANAWNGRIRSIDAVRRNGEGNAWSNLFFASKPCIAVRVRAAMPAWGIAITWWQLFCLRKRQTVML